MSHPAVREDAASANRGLPALLCARALLSSRTGNKYLKSRQSIKMSLVPQDLQTERRQSAGFRAIGSFMPCPSKH
jgi:hypothetical protein